MKEARVIIHRYSPTCGGEEIKYMWDGPIDGEVRVPIEFLGDKTFEQIPFKLMRMRNYDAHTAVFIRWDWRARIVRFITRYNHAVSAGKVSVDVKPVKRDLSDAEKEDE